MNTCTMNPGGTPPTKRPKHHLERLRTSRSLKLQNKLLELGNEYRHVQVRYAWDDEDFGDELAYWRVRGYYWRFDAQKPWQLLGATWLRAQDTYNSLYYRLNGEYPVLARDEVEAFLSEAGKAVLPMLLQSLLGGIVGRRR